MNSLLTRLILLIVAALAPTFALQLGTEIRERHSREQQGLEEAWQLARLVDAQQHRIADAARQALDIWAGTALAIAPEPDVCDKLAANFLKAYPRYAELRIALPEAVRPCGATINAAMGKRRIVLRRSISLAGAVSPGEVSLAFDPDWLQSQVDLLTLPPDSFIALFSQDGAVLASRPRDHAISPMISTLLNRSAPGVIEQIGSNGSRHLVAYVPARSEPDGLATVIELSRDRLLQSVDTAHRLALLTLVLGMALALAGALVGANALVRRPFVKVLTAAERMRQGDLAARVAMPTDGSEFGRLGAALDATAAALEMREHALRDALATAELTRLALGESEMRLRLALDSAEVSVWEIDLRHARVWVDHRAAELSRGILPGNAWVDLNDAVLRTWLDSIHPEDWHTRATALRGAMAGTRDQIEFEYRFRDRDGAWRWIAERGAVVTRDSASNAPMRIVGISRDVTEQRDAASALAREVADRTAALAESQSRFRSIFDATFQLTALTSPDGTLLEANRAWLEFCAGTAKEVLGRPVWETLAGEADPATAARIHREMQRAAKGHFVRCELELSGDGPRLAVIDFSLKPVLGTANTVAMIVAEARDITDWSRLQVQLAQAQKMEAVGQLTGGVAHDFNNLLQAVTGNLDLIQRNAEARGDARLLRFVSNAERAVQRGARLTQQLLAFSRRQNLRPERVLVSQLIAETLELLRRGAGEMVTVETHADPALWPSNIDPAQFESALLNLVINARDAMPHGGKLSIRAGNTALTPGQAEVLDIAPGDYIRVEVSDTGTGIAPEHLPRIFEPFFTTKEIGKGSGLGLAMVHGFARQSGGAVAIETALGQGTTIALLLPRDHDAWHADPHQTRGEVLRNQSPSSDTGILTGESGIAPTILVVEDNPEVLDTMQFALVDAGYRVLTARDGAEALDMLISDETHIDILLCDMMLPGPHTGDEIADLARAQRHELRVLLISGYAAEALAHRNRQADYEVLGKPFAQRDLLRRLSELGAPVHGSPA